MPTMLIALLEHPDLARRDLSCLRVAVSGGSPVPAELVRQVEDRLNVRFSIVFGTTECSPLITQVRLDDAAHDRAETLGSPLPQVDVRSLTSQRVLPCRSARSASSARAATW